MRSPIVRRLPALAVLGALLVVALPARADYGHLVHSGTTLACTGMTPCTSDAMCTGPFENCRALMGVTGAASPVCSRDPAEEVFCCTSPADCPVVGGHMAMCPHLPSGGTIVGLCVYVPSDYCLVDPTVLTSSDVGRIVACHTEAVPPCVTPPPPMRTAFVAVGAGDCDHDGLQNSSDPRPCSPDVTPCVDAGLPDSGVIDVDGGNTDDLGLPDAGDVVDAGGEPDAGETVDLGVAMDASTIPPGISFRGGGGCTCGVAGMPRGAGLVLVALPLALVAPLARRRRQSQR